MRARARARTGLQPSVGSAPYSSLGGPLIIYPYWTQFTLKLTGSRLVSLAKLTSKLTIYDRSPACSLTHSLARPLSSLSCLFSGENIEMPSSHSQCLTSVETNVYLITTYLSPSHLNCFCILLNSPLFTLVRDGDNLFMIHDFSSTYHAPTLCSRDIMSHGCKCSFVACESHSCLDLAKQRRRSRCRYVTVSTSERGCEKFYARRIRDST